MPSSDGPSNDGPSNDGPSSGRSGGGRSGLRLASFGRSGAGRGRSGGGEPAAGAAGQLVIGAHDLSLGYGHFPAVRSLNLEAHSGELVGLFGANGAGKTTTLLGLAGWLRPSSGTVSWLGATTTARMHVRVRNGLAYVPEESGVVPNLSVRDNFRLSRGAGADGLSQAPELERMPGRKGGLLSGGERQILALTRAISRQPKLILIDELSLGLAPLIVARLFEMLRKAADQGTAVIVVEQQVETALRYVDRGYVLRDGSLALEGTVAQLVERRSELEASYLSEV
jgi:branched-chain amino acid transport system ATP-binding protein